LSVRGCGGYVLRGVGRVGGEPHRDIINQINL
jgi:hypothetical protein